MSQAAVATVAAQLKKIKAPSFELLLGLDGFVDNIIDVVDKRSDAKNYTRVETITSLSERIGRAAGLSSNLELVVRQEKLGGNGPIMANALLEHGCKISYIGNLGKLAVHPVFANMAKRCKAVYSVAEPGVTDALEFRDGKLMFGKHASLKEVTYKRIVEVVGKKKLGDMWAKSKLIALTNWTMLAYQTDIWKSLLKDFGKVKPVEGATIFIDLADPEKRLKNEIAEAVRFLKNFRKTHRVILGLNQKESIEIGSSLGFTFQQEEIEQNAVKLREHLELDCVVVHPTRNAACATEKDSAYLDGPFCQNPKLTTGAGDNFNAGFCLGMLLGLSPQSCLATGVGNSGFYVRNARSAKFKDLAGFMDKWAKNYGDPAF